jgi:hypothetical protein
MEKLTVLLGAGFSVPFGMPTVADLTSVAEAVVTPALGTPVGPSAEPVPAAKMLHRALRAEYNTVDFELALHAVESLLSYAAADTFDVRLSDIHQVLRAFTDPAPRWSALIHFDTVRELRESIVNALVSEIRQREQRIGRSDRIQRGVRRSIGLISKLSETFALRCFTLNYDSVVDRHLNWNDGFGEDSPAAFSRTRFNNKLRVSEPMLCHLHGSIRYGFDASGYIAKFASAELAQDSYASEKSSKPNQAGELNIAGPIISGLRKLDKLTSTPYGYYYSAFINSIIENPRLLVIGYGFHDPHLDYWLGQHRTVHGERRRVVIVKKDQSLARRIDRGTKRRQLKLCREAAGVMWRGSGITNRLAHSWLYTPRLSYFCNKELMMLFSGYPFGVKGLDALERHLT